MSHLLELQSMSQFHSLDFVGIAIGSLGMPFEAMSPHSGRQGRTSL